MKFEPSSTSDVILTSDLKEALGKLKTKQKLERIAVLSKFGVAEEQISRIEDKREIRKIQSSNRISSLRAKMEGQRETIRQLREKLKSLKTTLSSLRDSKTKERRDWTGKFSNLAIDSEEDRMDSEQSLRSFFLESFANRPLVDAFLPAFILMREGRFDAALSALQLLDYTFKIAMPTIFQSLVRFFQDSMDEVGKPRQEFDAIFHFSIWGDRYIDRFLRYCLPSLLAANNLPWLSDRMKIRLLIHTDDRSALKLVNSDSIKAAQKFCNVEIRPYPGDIQKLQKDLAAEDTKVGENSSYFFLGAFQSLALAEAKCFGSHLMLFMPDNIFEDRFLEKIWHLFQAGNEVITCQAPATSAEETIAFIDAHSDRDGAVSISVDELVDLQVEHIHPDVVARTATNGNARFSPCPQQLFPIQDGFIIRAFHYHPIALAAKSMQHLEFQDLRILPADEYILSLIVDNDHVTPEEVFLPVSLRELGIIGMAESDGTPFSVPDTDGSMTTDLMLARYTNMVDRRPLTPFETYCLHNRVILSSDREATIPKDGDDREFFRRVFEHIEDHQA